MQVLRRNSEEMQGDENSLLVNHSFERVGTFPFALS
jgi:hypothetical protein